MLMLLSPSKTVDYETPATTDSFSIPENLEKSSELVKVLKQKSFLDLMELMQVSQNIAELNVERFNKWKLPFSTENAKQAVLTFKGDVGVKHVISVHNCVQYWPSGMLQNIYYFPQ